MKLDERIESFALLGETLRKILSGREDNFGEETDHLINNQYKVNPWFTPENVKSAIKAIANELTEENLTAWTDAYPQLREETDSIKVAIIMAGNIPLVGFHDFLSVLISGNSLVAKTSSKDSELIILIRDILCSINKGFVDRIELTGGPLTNFDIVIATGSDNSSRYFEYYFGKYPNIIRKNRSSVAIIDGEETDAELENLGNDIFSYFGLGCRNVSKIYIPKGYNMSAMHRHWSSFSGIVGHSKYANNYDFNKAVCLVNKEIFYDTGYLLMKEESRISSPVSVLYYQFYESQSVVKQELELLKEKIQCIVGRHDLPFGDTQSPHLWDFADGIDTIEFLFKKNIAGIL